MVGSGPEQKVRRAVLLRDGKHTIPFTVLLWLKPP